jgi:poly(A) polymerase
MDKKTSLATINNTVAKLLKPDAEIYIVGGWLRDELLGRQTFDMDLALPEDPATLAARVAKELKGKYIVLDDKNCVYRVILFNCEISCLDFSKFKGPTIEKDLALRDFTINTLARHLFGTKLIDPLGAATDIRRKVVRLCSPAAFKEDPLRMLRAFRFSAELGFSITPDTLKTVKKYATLINKPAGERVRDELFRVLAAPGAAANIAQMDNLGLLTGIFPEIETMKKHSKKFYFHPGGLWEHSMKTLEASEEVLKQLESFLPASHKEASAHFTQKYPGGITRPALLKLTALFHDLAKPDCYKKIDGRVRFLGHDSEGAKMFELVLRRLKLSKIEIHAGSLLVENHMRPITLSQAPKLTLRAMLRLFNISENYTPELLVLSLADCLSYRNITNTLRLTVPFEKQSAIFDNLLNRYFEKEARPPLPKIIDGNILIKRLKLKPGPEIGRLLKIISEAQGVGTVCSTKQALALAKKNL